MKEMSEGKCELKHQGITFLLFSKRENTLKIKEEGESSLSLPSLILVVPVCYCFGGRIFIFSGLWCWGRCLCVLLCVPAGAL